MLDCSLNHDGNHYTVKFRISSGRKGEGRQVLTLSLPDSATMADLATEAESLHSDARDRAHAETQARCRGERPPATQEPGTATRCQT